MRRLKLLWRAATWPLERFHGLVELTYAGDFDEGEQRFEDTGEVTTRLEGMVVVSYVASDDGTVLYVRRPFYDMKDEPSYYGLAHAIDN